MFSYMVPNQAMFMFGLFESFYSMFVKDMSTPPWFLPFRISVPFSTANLCDRYLLWFIQFNIGLAFTLGMITMTSYFIACCLYINAICDHVDLIMQEIINSYLLKMKFRVAKLVADINSGVIFSLLPAKVIILALSLYTGEHVSIFDKYFMGIVQILLIFTLVLVKFQRICELVFTQCV